TRTRVSRLGPQRWRVARRIGRLSLYRLTAAGAKRFEQAHRRIYAPAADSWSEDWELVIANGLSAHRRQTLAQELHWAGFGVLAAGVYARPTQAGNSDPLAVAAQRTDVIAVRARDDGALHGS